MRRLVVLTVASMALVIAEAPAQAGDARHAVTPSRASQATAAPGPWSPWKRTPSAAFDLSGACSVPIHLAFPVDRVEQRHRTDAGGNTEIESRGRFVATLTPKNKPRSHYTFDISGTSLGDYSQIAYANNDYLFRATGANINVFFGTSVRHTGMPRLAYSVGPLAVLYTGTKKADVITRPRTVINLCKFMGVGTAP